MTKNPRETTAKVRVLTCPRPACAWEWVAKVERPKLCPGCKVPLKWDKSERKQQSAAA